MSRLHIVEPQEFKPIADVRRTKDGTRLIITKWYGELRYGFAFEDDNGNIARDANGTPVRPFIEKLAPWKRPWKGHRS